MNDLDINSLTVEFATAFGAVTAVENLTTTFRDHKITGIIGESGSGKSVMGMSILQLLPETAVIKGSCMYRGTDLYQLREPQIQKIRGKEIGLIPQNPSASLNPMMKIKQQLKEPLTMHHLADKHQAENQVYGLLSRFGFRDSSKIANQYSFQMSGGMNQRIVSALGLVCNPPWVIADEPTKGLDAIMRNQVYRVLKKIYTDNHCGMLVITHDLALAAHLCHDIRVMYAGELIEQGDCDTVFSAPLHPYTKNLLQALPQNGMKPIANKMHHAIAGTSSCKFFGRCGDATQSCVNRMMSDFSTASGGIVRCFQYATS